MWLAHRYSAIRVSIYVGAGGAAINGANSEAGGGSGASFVATGAAFNGAGGVLVVSYWHG